jgi:UDP-N-acetylmuramoylalanine-D-glutamate ligase
VRFSELEGARIGVWGAGREIVSFAALLARRLPAARIEVAAFDEPPKLEVADALLSPGVRVVAGREATGALAACEVVVRSPGVSIHRAELAQLMRGGVPVTTATSLWLAERGGRRVIGVTGTKGKSTTAALAHHLALAAGEPAQLAGNIGRPALELLDADPGELAIVELSSYHVADLALGPEVAVITNLYD